MAMADLKLVVARDLNMGNTKRILICFAPPGYLTDDESPKRRAHSDLSDFKSVVQDCLDYDPKPPGRNTKPKASNNSNLSNIDKFSGMHIRDQLLSPAKIIDRFFRHPFRSIAHNKGKTILSSSLQTHLLRIKSNLL